MIKRSVVLESPSSLSLRNNQMVILNKESKESNMLSIEDLGVLIIENPMISISIPLINALTDNNVAVVFCDKKQMPSSMLQPLVGNNVQSEVYKSQIGTTEAQRKRLWKQIIECKIKNQSLLLTKLNKKGDILKPYYMNVKSGDLDNREGLAAKLYWKELFGSDFVRDRDFDGINILLNYGYSILRAAVARAIIGSGLYPAFGLFHKSRYNAFPLADDVMEPYRSYVDEVVYQLVQNGNLELNKSTKSELIKVIHADASFPSVMRPLQIGLSITTASLVRCLSGEEKTIQYPIIK